MAKKKKVEKPRPEFTKRQLSRWQQQKKRQRLIQGIGICIVVVVLGLVGVGWYVNQYQPLHQAVIKVNDTKFDMNYYIKMLRVYGGGQSSYYMYGIVDGVVKNIEQNELVRQGALGLGVSVSSAEVEEKLKSHDPPLSDDYRDVVRVELLADRLLEEYFDQEVPVSAEQRHMMAMLLEDGSQATEVRAGLDSGEDFGNLAGELSLESLSKSEGGDLGWHPEDALAELLATSVPGDYAFNSGVGVLSQPVYDETVTKEVGYWLVEVLERDDDAGTAHIQAILLGSEQQAQAVRVRLEAGEDFATLADELSQYGASGSGGDLGWVANGMLGSAVDDFIFSAELETLSEPIRDDTVTTTGGCWLLKVLDEDGNRELSEEDRDLLKTAALNDWVASLWEDPENEIDDSYLDDEKKLWAVEKAVGGW